MTDTDPEETSGKRRVSTRLVVFYLLCVGLWLFFLGAVVKRLFGSRPQFSQTDIAVDIVFVAVTAIGLYFLSSHQLTLLRRAVDASERRCRLMVENVRDYAIVMLDPAGHVVNWNRGARALTGYRHDEIAGRSIDCLYPETERLAGAPENHLKRAATEGQCDNEGWRQRRDGSRFFANAVITALRDENSRLVGFSFVLHDITPHKRTEEAQGRSLDFALSLLDKFPNPLWRADSSGQFTYFNNAWLAFTGRELQHELGAGWREGLHPEDRERCCAALSAAFEARKPLEIEYRLRHRDGSYHWVVDFSRPIYAPDRRFAGYIGSVYDSTERRLAEEKLRETNQTLQALIQAAPVAILAVDTHGRISLWNPAAERIFGWSSEEVLGKPDPIMPVDPDEPAEDMRVRALRGESFSGQEVSRRHRNGTPLDISLSAAPLFNSGGEITGVMAVLVDITEFKRAQAAVQQLAYYDALTGLPNRLLLQDRLRQVLAQTDRQQQMAAILFLDLDRFKYVNDTLGHAVGDELLKAVAERLEDCVRKSDTVARLGGDEFVVLLAAIAEAEDATVIARKILTALTRPFRLASQEIYTSTSIGIALTPGDGSEVDQLISNADLAMYQAKEQGRSTYRFFSPEMNARAQHRLNMETSLRRALRQEEFSLYYQPQVSLADGSLVGLEALLRWHHPEHGLLPAAEFLPFAEESGLIVPISQWMLRTACIQHQAWQAQGGAGLRLAVNQPTRHLRNISLADSVDKALADSGLPPQLLELELTENYLMENPEVLVDKLAALKARDVGLAIDDFGTGYSSLSYLERFDVDRLKIDLSFVRRAPSDPGSRAIIEAVIAMAHSLGMRVTAEGVETREQQEFLRRCGCDEGQGYFFGRPLPPEEIATVLRQRAGGEATLSP